ncbi:MAG: hypothetical protein WC435_01765 [Candidatus Paceibacterota bacterium]
MQEQEYEVKVNGEPVIVKDGRVIRGGEGEKSKASFEEIKEALGTRIGFGHNVSIGNKDFRRVSGGVLEEKECGEENEERTGSVWVGNGNSAFGHWHS